jgi:DNA-binding response OmpR family regulator
MGRVRVLVIEDDDAIRRGILDTLRFHGYETLEAADGRTGLDLALTASYDLILLDLVLPGADGLTVLREVRSRRDPVPVIVLTARGGEDDRVSGLKLGADDYVVKPFSVKELMARVEAVLRRSPERPAEALEWPVPGGVFDMRTREVRFDDGERSPLSEKEAELLRYLLRHAGQAVSRDELLARVWQMNPQAVDTRTVDMHVARLREKLRDDGREPRVIVTLRGRGYMFQPPAAPPEAPR